ncbi:MAG: hypothetical protein CL433_11915 [Acidimicrobiaceae bacterium]|nr:hypothetical protein [Acidimicrobiaceae bacterium]HAB56648.1 hypothetical protein [Acidimicrobiaceae bacterium]
MAEAGIAELTLRRGGAVWSQTDARAEPVDAGLRRELEDPDALVIVGTIDTTVVGYAACHVDPLHDGHAIARITDLYVLPDARKVGIGEAMMAAVEEWARKRSLVGLDAVALPGDRDTKNFFETFGLVARAIQVHRSLES